MPWGIAAAAVVSAGVGAYSSSKASKAQQEAANAANEADWRIFSQQREDLKPWREAGEGALRQLSDLTQPGGDFNRDFTMADFEADPGYAFRLDEGQKALERSAAARGGLMSGRTLKDLTRFAQNTASDEYSNTYNRFNNDRTVRFNRLSSIAGLGQTAQAQLNQASQNYAAQYGSNMAAYGNAAAAGAIGVGNAVQNGVGNAMDAYIYGKSRGVF